MRRPCMLICLLAFHLRNSNGPQESVIDESMALARVGNEGADMKTGARKTTVTSERHVYSHPELYARVCYIGKMTFLSGMKGE